jgi:hypothetical protein
MQLQRLFVCQKQRHARKMAKGAGAAGLMDWIIKSSST